MKGDPEAKTAYIMNIPYANYKNIFKSDLEAELMLDIFTTYQQSGDTDSSFWENQGHYIVNVLETIQSVSNFELSCDFLMDEEKIIIKKLLNTVE